VKVFLVFIGFLVLLSIGMPVAFAIGASGCLYFLQHPNLLMTAIANAPLAMSQNFALLAVPLFIFAGNLINAGGTTKHLVDFAILLTGHMKGGLGQVSVVLSTMMGGVSGSAVADAAMEARILGTDMIKSGYARGFAGCNLAFTGLITATIPPSTSLILYGTTGAVSVGQLFASGIFVGLGMMVVMMFTTGITAHIRKYAPVRQKRATPGEILYSLKTTIWALLFPVLLLAGIRFGLFTPSEVGSFACVYAILVGKFVYKGLTLKRLIAAMEATLKDVGAVMLIIIFSAIFSYGIPLDKVPQTLSAFMTGFTTNGNMILVLIIILLVFTGMFMDGAVVILTLTPIFLPVCRNAGIDPVHLGIIMSCTATLGNCTPPVGTSMYTVCSILNCSITEYAKEMIPFLTAFVMYMCILAFVPDFVLFLPKLLF
jgi:tripartite ATP-independent transporter DctM subunit